jgi:outer membrane protein
MLEYNEKLSPLNPLLMGDYDRIVYRTVHRRIVFATRRRGGRNSMISRRTIIGLAFILAAVCALPAASQGKLGVAEAVRLAKSGNIGMAQSDLTLNAAKRKADSAWADSLLSMGLTASVSLPNSGWEDMSANASASLSANLSPAVLALMRQAQLNYQAATLSKAEAERSLEMSVRKAFYDIILLGENVKVLEQSVKTSQSGYQRALERYNAGLVPELDVLSARVDFENLKPDLESAKQNYRNALGQFKIYLGLAQEKDIELDGSLETTLDASWLGKIDWGASSSTLRSLKKNMEIAKESKKATEAQVFYPSLKLSWGYNPAYTYQPSSFADRGGLSVNLSWSLDFLNPLSSSQEKIRSAGDSIKQIELNIKEQIESDKLRVSSLKSNLEGAAATLEALQLTVKLAQQRYDLTKEAFEKGAKDSLDLATAADSLESAKLKYLSQSYTLISNIIDLENALGLEFGALGRK